MYHEDHAIEPFPLDQVDASAALDHYSVSGGMRHVRYSVSVVVRYVSQCCYGLCAMFHSVGMCCVALDHHIVSVAMCHASQCWYVLSCTVLARALFHSVAICCVSQWCHVLNSVLLCAMFELVDASGRCVGGSGFRARGV